MRLRDMAANAEAWPEPTEEELRERERLSGIEWIGPPKDEDEEEEERAWGGDDRDWKAPEPEPPVALDAGKLKDFLIVVRVKAKYGDNKGIMELAEKFWDMAFPETEPSQTA